MDTLLSKPAALEVNNKFFVKICPVWTNPGHILLS